MGAVRIVTNKPGNPPKAVNYAEIDKQGRIPYAGEKGPAPAPMSDGMGKKVARGMGAAKRGGSYIGC
jgi:hypothetical protein